MTYGLNQLLGYQNAMQALGGEATASILHFFQYPNLKVKLPVYRDAKIALDKMNLVVFSHGNIGHRLA